MIYYKAYGTAHFVWAGVKGGFVLAFVVYHFLGTHLLEWRLSIYTLRSLGRSASQMYFEEKNIFMHIDKEKQNKIKPELTIENTGRTTFLVT